MKMHKLPIIMSSMITVTGLSLTIFNNSASASTWYNPLPTDNIECKTGYSYNMKNMQNGQCRINWSNVINHTISSVVSGAIGGAASAGGHG